MIIHTAIAAVAALLSTNAAQAPAQAGAATASAAAVTAAAAQTRAQAEPRYCLTTLLPTSRIQRKICKSQQEWFTADVDLPAN